MAIFIFSPLEPVAMDVISIYLLVGDSNKAYVYIFGCLKGTSMLKLVYYIILCVLYYKGLSIVKFIAMCTK